MSINRSMPPATIIPELPYPDVREAADRLCRAIGFVERLRIGNHRAQLQFGEGSLVVTRGGDSNPSLSVMVRLDDVDSHFEQAYKAGARIVAAPADFPYGELQYVVEDLGGHHWTFSQTIADIDPSVWGGQLFE